MTWSLFIFSFLLLSTVGYDFFFTVISINGAGSVSVRLSGWISRIFLTLSNSQKEREVLKYCGVFIILSLIIWWIGGLWLGFYILLLAGDQSVVSSSTEIATDAFDKFYYSGYVLSTMGNGDFKPGTSLWQIVIGAFSFSGFIFITTAMTYLISVSSAVIDKSSLGLYISDMMALDKEEDKINCIYENANDLRTMINRHNQNHLAYPIVHYFFSMDKKTSFSIGLWNLNALLISIQNKSAYESYKIKPLIHAVDSYLNTISEVSIPEVQRSKESEGVELGKLRKEQLFNLLKSDGWDKFKKEKNENLRNTI